MIARQVFFRAGMCAMGIAEQLLQLLISTVVCLAAFPRITDSPALASNLSSEAANSVRG